MWRDEAYLLDILLAARNIIEFTKDVTREGFEQSELIQSAVIRQFEIIGEAAGRVSEEFREEHPEIPWGEIIGMRNRLIHEYFRVKVDVVWETIQRDVPILVSSIEPLVPGEDSS
ncbi:MAG: DUF86 domain-containing protein [Armatimonadetes bacterium]|nr:DUF86 domain-containing protein [Armatimonadota bacterium]